MKFKHRFLAIVLLVLMVSAFSSVLLVRGQPIPGTVYVVMNVDTEYWSPLGEGNDIYLNTLNSHPTIDLRDYSTTSPVL